jgi:hypothetical protein
VRDASSKIEFTGTTPAEAEIVLFGTVGGIPSGAAITSYEIKCDGLHVLSPNTWIDSLSANHLDSYRECILDGMNMYRIFDIKTVKPLAVDITGFTFQVRACYTPLMRPPLLLHVRVLNSRAVRTERSRHSR